METTPASSLTPAQQRAVAARGNVLVMAGAGTGKTRTLVARCLDCLERERAVLDELLVITFTEAAAAEMRQRLRRAIEEKVAAESLNPQPPTLNFWREQLARFDIAHIGTLHGFCFKLVREHFYELGLDPQLAILDEGEARQRAGETLDELLEAHYAGGDDFSLAVQNLIQIHGDGRDEAIRKLVLRLHHYSQTRPDAAGWLTGQIRKFSAPEPADWQNRLLEAVADWCDEWLPVLENQKAGNEKAAELAGILSRLTGKIARESAAEVLGQIASADACWPAKRKTILRKPLEDLFDEAVFLASLATIKDGRDPLAEDWSWVRGQMETLLRLAQEFAGEFARRKLADGVLDFHDLEQFALKLLWNFAAGQPAATAIRWREKLKFVFVDEYQDINAAQDKIIAALAHDTSPSPRPGGERAGEFAENLREGNRFLVGDVKQSIYRFRLADPKIFRDYAKAWHKPDGRIIPLAENFRSREGLIRFVNSVFAPLMCEEIGGVAYDDDAKLIFGSPETRADFSTACDESPRAELLLRFKSGSAEAPAADEESGTDELADLGDAEKEARLLAARLGKLRADGHEIWDDEAKAFRPVEWRHMAILLRAPSGKSEIFAKEFERAGVPLVVERGGFYEGSEISDLLSLLQLLDNPLQDVPCIAVLRSPLVGLSLDELAAIRLTLARGHFWFALNQAQGPKSKIKDETRGKIGKFLERFSSWRTLARQAPLSRCLEHVLAETHYADWMRSQPRGAQRQANIGRFLHLAEKFDQFQRQGLYRFLKFIAAQREADAEPEVAPSAGGNAVRLMSIHQSKGLEFPVVALADLSKTFNTQDLRGEIIFDEELGLCPKVQPPASRQRYPSLPHWLAQRHQRRELAGEELRLLYVAMTRARDCLILTGSVTGKKWAEHWQEAGAITSQKILAAKSYADWLGLWFASRPVQNSKFEIQNQKQGELPNLSWRIAEDAELASLGGSEGGEVQSEDDPESPHAGFCGTATVLDEAAIKKLTGVLSWKYDFNAATERAAKSSVTALRREAEEADDEAEPAFSARSEFAKRAVTARSLKLTAADAGTAHHRFLQLVSLADVGLTALEAEAGRLEREKVLSPTERAALDLAAIGAFWNSDAGRKIHQHQAGVKRELAFTARFSPAELEDIIGKQSASGLEDEFIVVQGVADLVVLLAEELWLVDFKTDDVRAGDLPAKIKGYTPQLKLYAVALGRIYSRPVTRCWLHFLSARETVGVKI
jgi:ATP-dependent helicase/nuclease subunit A